MTRLRQVVLATRTLDADVSILTDQLSLAVSHRVEDEPSHAEFGLRARMLPVGDQFLEVVEPKHEETPVARQLKRMNADACGYMVILQVPSVAAAKQRVLDLGLQMIWEGGLDVGSGVHAIHLHPRSTGGTLLSLAESVSPYDWLQGGVNWQSAVRTEMVQGMAGVTIACRDPKSTAQLWAKILDLPRPASTLVRLEQGVLEFTTSNRPPHGPETIFLRAKGITPPPAPLQFGELSIHFETVGA